MANYSGIGVMTGTSLDGVDIAHCEFTEHNNRWTWKILRAETLEFPESLREKLARAPEMHGRELIATDLSYATFIGETIKDFCNRHQCKPDFAASHGQTIFHEPDKGITFQLGDGETISASLEFPVVSNFRRQDVALGGQGAPLVPFGEIALFPEHSLFLNLGGIANLGSGNTGFDVCVCNLALNWLAGQFNSSLNFDNDGKIAASGIVIDALFDELNAQEYFLKPGPKSIGQEWFQTFHFPLLSEWKNKSEGSVPNLLRTYVEHIAWQLKMSLLKMHTANENILISGGGTKNKFLLSRIEDRLSQIAVPCTTASDLIIEYKEALIFAFLGLMRLLGKENILASTTGAKRNSSGGSISGSGKFF